MKRRIGIVLEYGFHEIRNFIFSDLYKALGEKADICILTINKNNKTFEQFLLDTGLPIIALNEKELKIPSSKLEAYTRSVRKAWLRKEKIGTFKNYSATKNFSSLDIIKGNSFIKKYLSSLAIQKNQGRYVSSSIKQLIEQEGLTDILVGSYNSSLGKVMLYTAQALNLKTWVLVTSWKNLYINDFVPYNKLNGLFVWSDKMKADYLKINPHLDAKKVFVTGYPMFDRFFNYSPKQSYSYYREKYNLPSNAKIILYSMISPTAISYELEILQLIGNTILELFTKEEVFIVVRKNPMHDKDQYLNNDIPENIRILDHFWEWDAENDMTIQQKEGEDEWMDLLHYTNFNISIASTVTLECLKVGQPVINIGFDQKGTEDPNIVRYAQAPFYRDILNWDAVFFTPSIEDFKKAIVHIVETEPKAVLPGDIIKPSNFKATTLIKEVFESNQVVKV
jgi:hypothetical protein